MTIIKKEEKIRQAAIKFYKKEIEGEPLDQDVPIECFIAGANFIIKKIKKMKFL